MLGSNFPGCVTCWPEASGNESRPKHEVTCAWCLFVLHILTQNPCVQCLGCAQTCSMCGCHTSMWLCWTNNSLCQNAPKLVLPWVSAWPWVVWYASFSPRLVQMHAWNAIIWEAKDFLLERLVLCLMAHTWNGRWWPAPPAQPMPLLLWVRIKDHAWASLRLIISWPGIHHMIAGTW